MFRQMILLITLQTAYSSYYVTDKLDIDTLAEQWMRENLLISDCIMECQQRKDCDFVAYDPSTKYRNRMACYFYQHRNESLNKTTSSTGQLVAAQLLRTNCTRQDTRTSSEKSISTKNKDDTECKDEGTNKTDSMLGLRCKGKDNDVFCSEGTPCGKGDGDCDIDEDCTGELICGDSNCFWSQDDDCCAEAVKGLRCGGRAHFCCTADKPCDIGDGDCDSDEDCTGDLICGEDNCNWKEFVEVDCCVRPS